MRGGLEVIVLDGSPLDIAAVVAVARDGAKVNVATSVAERMSPARRLVEEAEHGDAAVYGVNTGFGALAAVRIEPESLEELQQSIIRSHSAGVGSPMDADVVRAMMLLRARTLAAGHAGVRTEIVEAIVDLLNNQILPVVPEHGSVGASGDLAPLAHSALALMGEGEVFVEGTRMPARDALSKAGLEPVRLRAKEGLALVNGTEGMLAMLCLALSDLAPLMSTADVVCAMTVEALLGTDRPFAEAIHKLRPHPGQMASAGNLRLLTKDSPIIGSHRNSDHAVQDAYSLRCAPQVHGACRDAYSFALSVAAVELASEVDNPIVLHEIGAVESAGNFHGEPLAFALDMLAIAVSELASISERRTDRMLDPARSSGLPPFLAPDAGVNSGFMLAQYTQAALVSECKRLAVPASVDNIPTSGTTEDHVSMGWDSGLKLRRAIGNASDVLAIEALCAAQALDLRAPLEPSRQAAAVSEVIRKAVPTMQVDRALAPDIKDVSDLLREGSLLRAAESVTGPLK